MEQSFEISINIMGDPENKTAHVLTESTGIFNITMPDGLHAVSLKNHNGKWVQTFGNPLDSNTLRSIGEALDSKR